MGCSQRTRLESFAPSFRRETDHSGSRRESPIRVGVSPCLLGRNVRYDGENVRDPLVTDTLDKVFEWVPTCPEVEIGLGVPRPTIQLERPARGKGICLVQPSTGIDLTTRMTDFCEKRAKALARPGLAGYLFKSRSPSCGIRRAKLYSPNGTFRREGRGLFAAEMIRRYPLLPVITEVELHDPVRRRCWITRVFAADRLSRLWEKRWTIPQLAAFHESYALTLQSHSAAGERRLRRILVHKEGTEQDLRTAYEMTFHKALDRAVSKKNQTQALKSVLARLRPEVSSRGMEVLESTVGDFETAETPLVEAVSVLRHYVQLTGHTQLTHAHFLFPDPREWTLRVQIGG